MPRRRKKDSGRTKLSRRQLSRHRLEKFKKEIVTDLHYISLEHLCARLETSSSVGLKKEKAEELLEDYGYNQLTPTTKQSEYVKFMCTLTGGFSLLLWVGAALCVVSSTIQYLSHGEIDRDNLILGFVLVIIIILTGCFMYYQEHKSSKIMESFANMVPLKATVVRDGKVLDILAKELVVGDLVEMKFGDSIPADVRIIKSNGFKVDNSSLTGESDAILRTVECTNDHFQESKNIAFFSTNAVEGTARGIVIFCGDETVMGRIAGLTARIQPNKTPLSRELAKFMRLVTFWACSIGVIFGVLCFTMGYNWIESALILIGIIVSNVPEGLLATVTVSLSITAKKMAAKNCLIKNLQAVETLGSTSIICSDKTGTLTQNKMTVCHLWYNNSVINADVSTEQNEASRYIKHDGFKTLMRCATLCSRAEFFDNQEKVTILRRTVKGDASEAAILKFAELTQCHGDTSEYRRKNPKIFEVPFSSSTKYQISVHHTLDGCLEVMKGAPEAILELCSTIYLNNETKDMTEILRKICDSACMELAAKGERVLGFADLLLPTNYTQSYPYSMDPNPNFPFTELRFVGFISLIDPPRPQVFQAVSKCRSAGIKVVMITGDHPVTAASIARDVGIITKKETLELTDESDLLPIEGDEAIVVPGYVLRNIASRELDHILFNYKEIVFARTSPTQKFEIVESCQRIGHIVAVTGDGVNDSPALKKADIGIAMGIAGTEVSKQSADMILLDDNFASLITGVEEGRKIFDNLKKSIAYVLASNIAEITPFLAFIVFGIPLPLGVLAVLCIDVFTDMLPAISLAYEEAESDIMMRPPRNPNKENLVTGKLYFFAYGHIGIFESVAGFFVYFMIMADYGFLPERLLGLREQWDSKYVNDLEDSYGREWTYEERKLLEYTCYTGFLISVVVSQWADVIICKTRRNSIRTQGMHNWKLNFSIFAETAIACALAYIPYNTHLKFNSVKLRWWICAMPFAVLIFIFDEFRKWHIRRYPNGYWCRETYY